MLPIGFALLVLAQAPIAPSTAPTKYVVVPTRQHERCRRGLADKLKELKRLQDFVVERQRTGQYVAPQVYDQIRFQNNDIAAHDQQPLVQKCEADETQTDAEYEAARQEVAAQEAQPQPERKYADCWRSVDGSRQNLKELLASRTGSLTERSSDYARDDLHNRQAELKQALEYVPACEKAYTERDRMVADDEAAAAAAAAKKRQGGKATTKRPAAAKPQPIDEPLQVPTPACGSKPPLWVWNHSIRPVEKYLERVLDDPESLKWDDDACTDPVWSPPKCWSSVCRFRAKNKFGALVRQRVQFWFTEREVLEAHEVR